ncbi:ABC transporter substrate-binding protein [Paenibacillus mesophilus]|uniref:ABC transporter substrate-binding protein n=1 Tax=Paenibacillus mesophilus TaxID=2582849 RepID=UPI0013050820|nr:extracellular solute-binding protein [Paenibacillus mesophilus]
MTATRKYGRAGCILAIGASLLAACSQDGGEKRKSPGDEASAVPGAALTSPVTLHYYTNDNTKWLELEKQLIAKKYPNVTLKVTLEADQKMDKLVAAGELPDFLSFSLGSFWDLKSYGLISDMAPLMKKYKFDESRFIPGVLESVRSYSETGEMQFLPFELNSNVLFYNKAIFDKFGVSYPRDGMTWEELYELARKVSRKENGTEYKGFIFQHQNLVWKNQLGLPFVDPKTSRAAINTAEWKKWLEVMGGFYFLPNNDYKNLSFYKDQTIAMWTGANIISSVIEASASTGLNWDVVSLPQFGGGTSGGTQMIAPFYAVPPGSKHKDEAFQVISYLLSEEVQIAKAKQGKVPIVNSPAATQAFAEELKGVSGKNMGAFLKDKIGKPAVVTKYDGIAKDVFYKTALGKDFYSQTKDVNTILREVEEEINRKIKEAQK